MRAFRVQSPLCLGLTENGILRYQVAHPFRNSKDGMVFVKLNPCRNKLSPMNDGFDPWVRKIPWKREWLPTPKFLPGKSHGQRSLVGYSPWGCKESDTTEQLTVSRMTMICPGSSLQVPQGTSGFIGGGLSWLRGNGRESETWAPGLVTLSLISYLPTRGWSKGQ